MQQKKAYTYRFVLNSMIIVW